MSTSSLIAEREHLANLLEALQRCAHFLHASSSKVAWPLDGPGLKMRQKDEELFGALASYNERQALEPVLIKAAARLLALCSRSLNVAPATADFEAEFQRVCRATGA